SARAWWGIPSPTPAPTANSTWPCTPGSGATGSCSPETCAPMTPRTYGRPPTSCATSRATRARAGWCGCSDWAHEPHARRSAARAVLHRRPGAGPARAAGPVGDGGRRVGRLRGGEGMRAVPVALLVALAACGRGAPPADQRAGLPEVRHDEHVFAGGAAPTAVRWQNPYRRDQRAAAEGAKIFTAMNCDGCHGGAGAGWVGPSLADGRWRFGGADGEIFQSIFYGRPHGMPAYGGLLLA